MLHLLTHADMRDPAAKFIYCLEIHPESREQLPGAVVQVACELRHALRPAIRRCVPTVFEAFCSESPARLVPDHV